MYRKINWNEAWHFTKNTDCVANNRVVADCSDWEECNLPHTWNGTDGQDGGNDYYRGTCFYHKHFSYTKQSEKIYLEFEGANSSCDVYVNGHLATHHDGGYSTFRAEITSLLTNGENEILVAVDNSDNDFVYPQFADFTFYGGLYRNVSLIYTEDAHFQLDYFGGPGIAVTPIMQDANCHVSTHTYFTGLKGNETLTFTISDGVNTITKNVVDTQEGEREIKEDFIIENAHLWHGVQDPFLYTLEVVLSRNEEILDTRTVRFGCRSFEIHPEKGFLLNGKSYPLRGVSRHQDRPEIGNALLPEHHKEDLELIAEMGANTIRLAHYQHDSYVYDLADEMGFVLWAEIPYISKHLPNGRENTISQMKELIIQNYNHPSIVVWGISNEITMKGAQDEDLIENHRILNDLCHEMDKTRLTTIAIVSMCPTDSDYIQIPDTVAWNHYFGWYGGNTSMNGPWLDRFHETYPNLPVGLSEYGCEALNWHTSEPEQGDYTEEYQAVYHEELIKQIFTRPYLWSTYVWNMFDFAADARSEGGEDGMNHKGLITFDRKYKKDSFFAYKAWLSDEPFVHICGKRYINRVEETTKVTVYSNQPTVELFANGVSLGTQTSELHFFYFDVPNNGKTTLVAKAGTQEDTSVIQKVDTFDDSYRMRETGDVLNWFDITTPEGYFSIQDKVHELLKNDEAKQILFTLLSANRPETGEVKNDPKKQADFIQFISDFTVKRIMSMMGMFTGKKLSKDEMLKLNQQLNQIAKV